MAYPWASISYPWASIPMPCPLPSIPVLYPWASIPMGEHTHGRAYPWVSNRYQLTNANICPCSAIVRGDANPVYAVIMSPMAEPTTATPDEIVSKIPDAMLRDAEMSARSA